MNKKTVTIIIIIVVVVIVCIAAVMYAPNLMEFMLRMHRIPQH